VSIAASLLAVVAPHAAAAAAHHASHHHHAAPPADPVVGVVQAASKRGHLAAADRNAYLSIWKDSARTGQRFVRAHSSARAGAIEDVRAITIHLATHHLLTAARMPAVFANVNATTWVMRHHSMPTYAQRIQLPGDPVVYGYYPGSGMQLQPLFTFAYGNVLNDISDTTDASKLADRMLKLSVMRNGYRTWEYYFNWEGGTPPWVSGIAQATALQFYVHTWKVTQTAAYLRVAQQALKGFYLHPKQGGFMLNQGSGRWYLLYGFKPQEYVLNADLQAMIGLRDYYDVTRDVRGLELMQDGVRAVIPLLHRFDTGAWSRYDFVEEAPLNYHDLMTHQLAVLGNSTNITDFSDLSHKFAMYRRTPPTIVVGSGSYPVIYPVKDGWHDATTVRYFVDKRSRVVVRVTDVSGNAVRTFVNDGPRGWYSITWDGWTGAHRMAPAGSYTLNFSARDIVNNLRVGQMTHVLTVRRDTTAPLLVKATVKPAGAKASRVVVRASDSESPWIDVRIVFHGKVVAQARTKRTASLRVPVKSDRLMNGGKVMLTDSSGNRRMFDL
jgi:hypothetical protein